MTVLKTEAAQEQAMVPSAVRMLQNVPGIARDRVTVDRLFLRIAVD